ncbi:MAG TPA: hypothetical protein VNC63_09790 [Propionibacteriaceae bacterium]|jgi:hypothetical protein|nr:hypothetical protein [Propionibacteriaceae bacterium]
MSVPVKIARAQASARLVKAIDDLARSGMLPHCADRRTSHLWLSDHLEDRAQSGQAVPRLSDLHRMR